MSTEREPYVTLAGTTLPGVYVDAAGDRTDVAVRLVEPARTSVVEDDEEALISYLDDGLEAAIVAVDDGSTRVSYELRWGDHVANVWRESYQDLSVAVARFAVLLHCAERDFHVGFRLDEVGTADTAPDRFATHVAAFHEAVTS